CHEPAANFEPNGGEQAQDWDAVAPKRPRVRAGNKMGGHRLIVVLEGASLETLLNCDKHKSTLLKNGRDPGEVRPEIAHQSLLMLMDTGLLQVYIHTQKNVLIEVNPQTRIPRPLTAFVASWVIKNPVSDHFPVGCMKAASAQREPVPSTDPTVSVVGAFAHGKVSVEYTKMVSISNYPLSVALICVKLTTAFEEVWGVI
uniref:EMG1 N1-specific pseudouridine methyltransferase n=1 Tax=Saimiri boliviensis boliviensis TaxID=39432 RepID=A0A2K6SXN3_SAIBB